ncbi:hypothetical protein FOG50_01880 [Hanseniaspora uvarum]|nr:hypothetical protein FOG50_01880 [Hanseniaspora uvarum]
MFKDIRIKKNQSSADKAVLNTSLSATSVQSQNNLNFFNNSTKRKSIDSEASFESLRDNLQIIKGTVTHEWGPSSSKKKNHTIIKLNNTDGTPLASPIKMSSVNSNENLDLDTLFEDKKPVIQDYKSTSGSFKSINSHDKFEIEQKRKHNRAARILSNEQFLNFQVDSLEDEKMIEKINNGNLFQSPIKKGTIFKKNNLTVVSKDSSSQLKNLAETSDEDDDKLFIRKQNNNSMKNSDENVKKGDLTFALNKPQFLNPPSLNREFSSNSAKNNRERSVSMTNSVTSETSDISESSQFSFQFKGRNASVKYYAKNKNPDGNEMNYFDDMIDEDFDLNNGLTDDYDDEYMTKNENYDISENNDSQPHDDDEDEHTFGMGYSTIAHISEHSSDEELETNEQDDEFNMFNSGFSNIANISEEEDDTIDDAFVIKNNGTVKPKLTLHELETNYEEQIEEDSGLTPTVETVNNNIKKFHDLFEISDEDDADDVDETPKIVKIKSNETSKPINKVTNYNDLFSLSEPDDEDGEYKSINDISSPIATKKYMFNSNLDDYVNEETLGELVQEMNELIPEEEKNTFLNSSKSILSKDTLLSAPTITKETTASKLTSPLYKNLLAKSPKLSQKKNYGYAQFYGMNSIAGIYDDPLTVSPLIQSPNANLVNLPPRNILKYHDLNTDLDSSIPKRMGDLFFIEEEDEDAVKDESSHSRTIDTALLGNDDSAIDDDLILDEINEIPEDYDEEEYLENTRFTKNIHSLINKKSNASLTSFTLSENEEEAMETDGNNINSDKLAVPKRLFGNKQKTKYHKFFHKANGLVARNDKPMSNKVSIKNKTITFFKKQPQKKPEPIGNTIDVDLSPIQEKRVSIEEL